MARRPTSPSRPPRHLYTPHASGPNGTDRPRLNLVITYIAPQVRPLAGRDTAMLVRGTDGFGHFEPEPRPEADFAPAAVEAHARHGAAQRDPVPGRGGSAQGRAARSLRPWL